MVVLPVFLQAPWVRLDPFSATLFTGVLVAAGLVMHQSRSQTTSDLGSLLVGFSGSWLAGCIFWGWLRAHPVLHLPVEAFAVPVALGGLQGRWRLAATFYLSSLVGTACTDLASGFSGDAGSMAAAVLITTLWVDGLFLLSALLQPGLSGLIE